MSAPSAETGAGAHTNLLSLRRVTVSPFYADKLLVYRTGDRRYERDAYAEFLVPPDEMLDECLRLYLRQGHAFATVLDPDSGLNAACCLAVSVSELYGDFRQADQPLAVLRMRFLLYSTIPADYGRVLWQQEYGKNVLIAHRTAAALVAGWDAGLKEIMNGVNTELNQLTLSDTPPAGSRGQGPDPITRARP